MFSIAMAGRIFMKKSSIEIKDEFESLKKALVSDEVSEAPKDASNNGKNGPAGFTTPSNLGGNGDKPPKKITKKLSYFDLMIYNKAKMQVYYNMSRKHANISFVFALIASFIGIVFFIIASVMVISGNADNFAVIIPAAGSAITGIIAGTIFVVYNKSLKLMNHFFDSLEITDKFLATVSLVDEISDGKKDDNYMKSIKSLLDSAGSKESKVNNDEK